MSTKPTYNVSSDFCEQNAKLCSIEARAAINEVAFGVKHIGLSTNSLPCTDSLAYINLTTFEGEQMCIEVSAKGFCPVGSAYNEVRTEHDIVPSINSNPKDDENSHCEYYETIYALLSARSSLFRDSFSQQLTNRLKQLPNEVENV